MLRQSTEAKLERVYDVPLQWRVHTPQASDRFRRTESNLHALMRQGSQ